MADISRIAMKSSSLEEEEGAVMILFAFILFPLIVLAAMAVELSRQTYINTQLAYACDAAAIAGARYDLASVEANALKVFYANYPPGVAGNLSVKPTVTLSSDSKYVSVSVVSNMPTTLGIADGILSLRVSGYSQVRRDINNIEVALVLDVTGSMRGAKFAGLKVAAKGLVNAIYEDNNTLENTAISIVPYAANVNIGTSYKSWLSDPSTLTTKFPSKVPWKGCVGAVDITSTMDNDNAPSSSRKWPVYFVESTLNQYGSQKGDNDWKANSNGTITVVNPITNVDVGPNRSCGDPILPLTNNRDVLLSKIDGLELIDGGGTFGNLGLVWGWNTISPKWNGKWTTSAIQPKPYSETTEKTIVIVTDGENQWFDLSGYQPTGDQTAYGRVSEGKLGVTSISQATSKIDARVTDLCTKIKAQGIQLFTVTFQVSSSSAKQLYKNCATKPEWAFNAENSEQLAEQFFYIAKQIKQITIVK